MKKHIWSNPTKEWEGFRFATYSLDSKKAWELPLTKKYKKEEKTEEISTTVGEAYKSLAEQPFEIEPYSVLGVQITANNDKVEFKGPAFNCQVLEALLLLRKDGINPFSSLWFWYESDSCRDDPHESYRFFVVHSDKIVRESLSFSDYHGNGFDPDIFVPEEESDFIWFNDADWSEARTRFWYRKFYSETRMGQLMVLRPDEPILYHYPRAQILDSVPGAQMPGAVVGSQDKPQSVTLLRTYRLLLVAIPLLAAIAFPWSKDLMGPVAIALLLDFLWACWKTRTR